jgi:hypothetical protein
VPPGYNYTMKSVTFVIAFAIRPKSVDGLRQILFGNEVAYKGWPTDTVSRVVLGKIDQRRKSTWDILDLIQAGDCGVEFTPPADAFAKSEEIKRDLEKLPVTAPMWKIKRLQAMYYTRHKHEWERVERLRRITLRDWYNKNWQRYFLRKQSFFVEFTEAEAMYKDVDETLFAKIPCFAVRKE